MNTPRTFGSGTHTTACESVLRTFHASGKTSLHTGLWRWSSCIDTYQCILEHEDLAL